MGFVGRNVMLKQKGLEANDQPFYSGTSVH